MNRKLALAALSTVCALRGEKQPLLGVEVTKTEKADFAAGGTLRLEHSVGEVTIEGWDQPGVEITTTKSTLGVYSQKEEDREKRALEGIQITTKREGDEVVVTTQYPSHRAF